MASAWKELIVRLENRISQLEHRCDALEKAATDKVAVSASKASSDKASATTSKDNAVKE